MSVNDWMIEDLYTESTLNRNKNNDSTFSSLTKYQSMSLYEIAETQKSDSDFFFVDKDELGY